MRGLIYLIRGLAVLGALAIFLGTARVVLGFAFYCIDTCPQDEVVHGFVARDLMTLGSPVLVIVLALLLPPWILCLVLLARRSQTRSAVSLALVPLVSGALALGIMLLAGQGELVPTRMATFHTWTTGLIWAGTELLLWPVAILVVSRLLGSPPRRPA